MMQENKQINRERIKRMKWREIKKDSRREGYMEGKGKVVPVLN
jgi:hypothetical protein